MSSKLTLSSKKPGGARVLGTSRNSLGVRKAKRVVLFTPDDMWLVAIERDRIFVCFIAAFFSESMRRDAISGMRIVLALENGTCHRSSKYHSDLEK